MCLSLGLLLFYLLCNMVAELFDLRSLELKACLVGNETCADGNNGLFYFKVVFLLGGARFNYVHDNVGQSENRGYFDRAVQMDNINVATDRCVIIARDP